MLSGTRRLPCLEESPWLARSVFKVAFQVSPLDLFLKEFLCVEGHAGRVPPSGPETERFRYVTVHHFAVDGAARLEGYRSPGLAHVFP